jgi:hypothetical protein
MNVKNECVIPSAEGAPPLQIPKPLPPTKPTLTKTWL